MDTYRMTYSIRINGTVISAILAKCAGSLTDIEGFLLGTFSSQSSSLNITDASDTSIKEKQDYIIIHGYSILLDKPYTPLKTMPPNVVGYFRHRKQADGSLTAADIQFMKMFSERVVHSCMCIISSSMNDVCDTSTHNHQYVFWDMRHHHKGMLTMKIANVTESTLNYQRFLSSSPFVIPSTSGDNAYSVLSDTMFTQYENLFKESMLILENSLNKVNVNEQRLVTLRKEIEQLESTQQ